MKDLIERLEKASEGSRELDDEIYDAIGRPGDDDIGYYTLVHGDFPARFTTSLDAALTLVPEGAAWVAGADHDGACTAEVHTRDGQYVTGEFECRGAATPALALCIAALKARGEA